MLRNFRDQDILHTRVGSSFMLAFNAFYYSFSPQVAAFITANSALRSAMKIILYPLINILAISSWIFESLPFNPELAVTLSGIVAGFGIGAVYGGPITILLSKAARRKTSKADLRRIAFFNISCACGLTVAEFGHLNTLLTVSSVAVVLSFLVLGAHAVGYLANRTMKTEKRRLGFQYVVG